MDNSSLTGQPSGGRVIPYLKANYERFACYILFAWCLLPVFMSLNYILSGILGMYPSEEELHKLGLVLGEVNYTKALKTYQTAFFVLGAVTFCFALLGVVLSRRLVFSLHSVRKMPWFYLLCLFLIWALICALCGSDRETALLGSGYMLDGWLSYLIYGSVFLCACAVRREDYRKKILRCFAGVICYLAAIMLVQESVNNAFINYVFSSRGAAVFNQFNHFGYMLCTALMILVGLFLYDREAKQWLHWLYLVGAIYLAYALTVNDTFGAMLAAIAALPVVLVLYLRSGRKLKARTAALVLVLILLTLACFFLLSSGKNGVVKNFAQLKTDLVKIFTHASDAGKAGTNRMGLWRETVDIIEKNPILGIGPEGMVSDNALTDNLLPHNTYLQIAAYTGVVGLLVYLAALLSLAKDRWRRIRRLDPMMLAAAGGALTYLISAFVGCPVFNTEPYLWLLLGITASSSAGGVPLVCTDTETEAEEEELPPTLLMRILRAFPRHYEGMAFGLLLAWCLLPAAVSVLYLITGALGKYPTEEQLLSAGLVLGSVNYVSAIRTYQTLFFILGALTILYALLCLALCRREVFSRESLRQRPWYCIFAALLAWAVISSFTSDFYYHAFLGGSYFRDGLASYFIYAALFLCASVIRREDQRRRILRCFAGVMCYLALIMLVQEVADNHFFNYVFSSRRAAVFNQFNHFGYMLCMAFACVTGLYFHDRRDGKKTYWAYAALALFLACALMVNNTFGAILASILSVPVILIFYVCSGKKLNRKITALVLALIVLALAGYFIVSSGKNNLAENFSQLWRDLVKIANNADDAGEAGTGRLQLWKDTLQRISERPVFGFGPEGFFGKNAITDEKRPHNEYLQIAGYLGIPALVLYLAALLTLTINRMRRLKKLSPMVIVAFGMTAAYLISAFVGNPVYNTALYFWLVLGLTTGVCAEEKPLLCPESAEESGEKGAVHFTRLGLLACVLLCVAAALSLRGERSRELEDLRTMQAAENAAREYVDPSTVRESAAYYWYDKKKGYLYPAFMAPPDSYGVGSTNAGGGRTVFGQENGYVYKYEENEDYSDKLIVVAVAANPSDELQVAVTWYAPQG
ncbi:MAG: O-antigen ligase family protein [Oscillospiraceae bacterium]|nr:O-antigen ligase family protein [Oscillospiraceae bacterium]